MQLPDIEGIGFRYSNGKSDSSAFWRLQENRIAVDGIDKKCNREEYYSPETFTKLLENAQNQNSLDLWPVVELNGNLAAFGNIECWKEENGRKLFRTNDDGRIFIRPYKTGQGSVSRGFKIGVTKRFRIIL